MLEYLRDFIPALHREGRIFVLLAILATLLFFAISNKLGWLGVVLSLWCAFFFRDPNRVTPLAENLIISPADGIVQSISEESPPSELDLGDVKMHRVSIFLNVFDVHVNRIPTSGQVSKLHYHQGKFLNASLDKASIHNERQSILITTKDKQQIAVVQIAGLIARRIVCDLEEKQQVKTGERFGIIRFGSRVDLYLPLDIYPQVAVGQRMLGGETVIASFNSKLPQMKGVTR